MAFGGDLCQGSNSTGDIFKSADSGKTWNATGLFLLAVDALAIDPMSPARIYAGGAIGFVRSTDGGSTWDASESVQQWVTTMAVVPTNASVVYAGLDGGHAVIGSNLIRTTDSGDTWTPVSADPQHSPVNSLIIDPTNPNRLYFGTATGLFRTTDSGTTWNVSHFSPPGAVAFALAVDPLTPSTLYAGTTSGVFRSVDSGVTWVRKGLGSDTKSLALDPRNPAVIYAGTWEHGVFRSTDSGDTWTAFNSGLTNLSAWTLAIDSSPPVTLYAGTIGGGVFSVELSAPPGTPTIAPTPTRTPAPTAILGECSTAYEQGILADSPTAYYRLNEVAPANGTVAVDRAGNWNGLFVSDGVAEPVSIPGAFPAATDSAVLFGMPQNLMTAPDFHAPPLGDFTMELWIRTAPSGDGQYVTNIDYNHGSIIFGYLPDTLEIFGCGEPCRSASGIAVPDDGWHHYAWTYSSSAETLTAYRDGTQIAAGSATCDCSNAQPDGGLILAASGPEGADHFDGALDEVAFYWGQALSPAKIDQHVASAECGMPTPASTWTRTPTRTQAPTRTPTEPPVWAANAACSAVPFYETLVPSEAGTASMQAADLNGDGNLDIVFTSSESVQVVLGSATGELGAPTFFHLEAYLTGLAVGDLNDDGIPDVVASEDNGGVFILLGDGSGGFVEPTHLAMGDRRETHSVTIADFSSDGIPDLAVLNRLDDVVWIRLGTGDGAFADAFSLPTGTGPSSLAAADFNGDGKLDLAVVTGLGVSVHQGTGTGTFGAFANFGDPGGNAIVAGDFDSDSKADLAVARSPGVEILLGTGTGAFLVPTYFAAGIDPSGLAMGDFNGDGKPDLVVTNNSRTDVMLLGLGNGSFTAPTNIGRGNLAAAAGDFNGDGQTDISLAGPHYNILWVLLNAGIGPFGPASTSTVGFDPSSAVVGDFNADAIPDLAVSTSDRVFLTLGVGGGKLAAATEIMTGTYGGAIAVGNFNTDAVPDLAVVNQVTNVVSILTSTGEGSFGAPTHLSVGTMPLALVVADFNVDGKADLAVANYGSNDVSLLLGSEAGSFAAATTFEIGGAPTSAVAEDFNADGSPDLAVAISADRQISILLGTGDGGFDSPSTFPTGMTPGSLVVADFNDDGIPDLGVTEHSTSSSVVSIFLGTGTGSFEAGTSVALASPPGGLAVGDFNVDGRSDLAVVLASDSTIALFFGTGSGGFSPPAHANMPYSTFVTVGDYDGNGTADLAVGRNGLENFSIMLNSCAPLVPLPTATTTSTNPTRTPTPAQTPTSTVSATASSTTTPTATPTNTATATASESPTPTETNSPTVTPTSTPTTSPSSSATSSHSPIATATSTATEAPTSTATETTTASSTPTATPTETLTETPTATASETATHTPTATLAAGCKPMPDLGCAIGTTNKVQLKTSVVRPKLSWSWDSRATALPSDFGAPATAETSYRLCVYDERGGAPNFRMGITIPGGGTCGVRPCWKALGTAGWSYNDKLRSAGGAKTLAMKVQATGKQVLKLTASGLNLPLPAPFSGSQYFAQDGAVVVQLLRNDAENCWSSTFDISARRNDYGQFVARKP